MSALNILNAKEKKRVLQQLETQFGCDLSALKEKALLLNTKGKVYAANTELCEELDLDALKVDAVGLYIATRIPNGEFRVSVEGSQLLGPSATKNVLGIDDAAFAKWIRGQEIDKETDLKGFVLVRHGSDFCGCGKPVVNEKTGKMVIHNYVPKTRHVRSEEATLR